MDQVGMVDVAIAVLLVAISVYCVGRLAIPQWRGHLHSRDIDVLHVGMGLVMAAMALQIADPLWTKPLVFIFAIPAAWFLVRASNGVRQHGRNALAIDNAQVGVMSVGMIAMASIVAMPVIPTERTPMDDMPGMEGMTVFPVSAVALATGLAALAVVNVAQLILESKSDVPRRLAVCCNLAMASSMAYLVLGMS